MGWKEGESLGKTNLGLVEPLKMQIKTDRKGKFEYYTFFIKSDPKCKQMAFVSSL